MPLLCDVMHLGIMYFDVKWLPPMFRVHVRRTDKLPEAVYHNIEEYMEHVSHSLLSVVAYSLG